MVYFAMQSHLPSFLPQEIYLTEMITKKKKREQHLLDITSVTLSTTAAYRILKSGQTKLLWSQTVLDILYMLHTLFP